jgi:hypothetical protein
MSAMTAPATAVAEKPKERVHAAPVETLYLITGQGLEILIGKEGDWVREKIKEDKTNDRLAYRKYDDDKRVWATWAVLDADGQTIKPMSFPDPADYGMTPPELYTKVATYRRVLAHAVGLLRKGKQSLWDRMMKPTTIVMAIIGIVLVTGILMVAAQG